MSADHKRPLIAFVIVALLCALIIADTMRSQAVVGMLRSGGHRVVAGMELAPLAPGHQLARQPVAQPGIPTTVASPDPVPFGSPSTAEHHEADAGTSPAHHPGTPGHQPGSGAAATGPTAGWHPVPGAAWQHEHQHPTGPQDGHANAHANGNGFPGAPGGTAPEPHSTQPALQQLGGVIGELTDEAGPSTSVPGHQAPTGTPTLPGHDHWLESHPPQGGPGLGPEQAPGHASDGPGRGPDQAPGHMSHHGQGDGRGNDDAHQARGHHPQGDHPHGHHPHRR